jgi:SAM-dependent methyltransferase
MIEDEPILADVARYYGGKLEAHGAQPRGVDWNSFESQQLRFRQLTRVIDAERRFSLNDFGCGYAALVDYLVAAGAAFGYVGYDIAPGMIETARQRHAGRPDCLFTSKLEDVPVADYTIAGGVFNVKLTAPEEQWNAYVLRTLDCIDRVSSLGFAVNLLTSYCDPERMRPDLFYADPCVLFDHCKRRYSRNVALLHDYGLYEFTVLVRKVAS